MVYKELRKIFYQDEAEYEKEYKTRLTSGDTIKLNFKIKGNHAFFTQNAEVAGIVFQILKADKKVSLISGKLPGIAHEQYSKMCLIDEIVLTNKIEGVYSTRREIASILSELEEKVNLVRKTRKRFWGLVNRYVKLRFAEHVPLRTCEDMRQLYDELILAEVIEEDPKNAPDGKIFRKESTSVYSPAGKEIHRGVYPESLIISQLEEALEFLHDENVEFIYRIVIFHYLFEYIHPFYDGNGRLGRFILSSLLTKELNPLLSYRISSEIAEYTKHYYDAFNACNDPLNLGDMTPFLIAMLGIIRKAVLGLEETLRVKYRSLKKYEEKIVMLPGGKHHRTYNAYFVLIEAALFSEHGISTGEFTGFLGSSYTTAKKELDFIDGHSLLIKNRVGKENCYLLDLDKLDSFLKNLENP